MWPQARKTFERWLFAHREGRDALTRIRELAQYPYALVRDLLGGRLNIHAMGLVYATLLAMIPLVALSFAILRIFGVHRQLEPLIFEFFRPMGAAAGDFTHKVMGFADHVRGGLVGSVGLFLLVWTLIGALRRVENSLNFVWHVEVPRGFIRRVTEYLALLVIAPLLVGVLFATARVPSVQSSYALLAGLPLLSQVTGFALALAPFAISSSAFVLVYALIPNTRVALRPALIGGLAAGIAWAALGRIFTALIVYSSGLTVVYAGFAIFVAALLWIYFSWVILLLGAQLSFYVQNPSYLPVGLREPQLSIVESEQLALDLMCLVARRQLEGGAAWSVTTLAARLRLPGILITRLADELAAAGLLQDADDETLQLAREPAQVGLQEILAVTRAARSLRGDVPASVLPAVARAHADFEQAWRSALGTRTLAQLAAETGGDYSPAIVRPSTSTEPQRMVP